MGKEENSSDSKETGKVVEMFEMECLSRNYFTSQREVKGWEQGASAQILGGVFFSLFVLLWSRERGIFLGVVRTWDLELEQFIDLISCCAIYYLPNLKQIYLFSLSAYIYVHVLGYSGLI